MKTILESDQLQQYTIQLFPLFVRLQSSPQVSVWKIQQQRADWHHGALWSREIHSDEYSGGLQVSVEL